MRSKIINLLLQALIIYIFIALSDILYSLYNPRYIVNIIKFDLFLFFTIIAILLLKNFYLRVSLILFLMFLVLLEYLHFQYFGTYIQPISFYQFFNNTQEVFESFFDEIKNMLVVFFIVILITLALTAILSYFKKIKTYKNNLLALFILGLLFIYSDIKVYNSLHSKSGKLLHKDAKRILPISGKLAYVNFCRAFNYFIAGILPKKILSNKNYQFNALKELKIADKNVSANIILVIGESLRAKQLHLLGYKLQTTPNLEKIDKLFYSEIYASGTMTKTAVSALLNRLKYPGATSQLATLKNNLFYLAKKNKFKTYFYSNQKNHQLKVLNNFLGLKFIDFYASKEDLENRDKIKTIYDDKLLLALKKVNLKDNNFIVLHMRGSHSPYHKQYPKNFNKFKLTYDNTVLYTDFVLSQIIKYLKKHSKKPTYFIFTSDHGELLGEFGKRGHGWFYKEVYKVPFIFYAINNNKKLPLNNIQSHFQVSNLIAKLLGYNVNIKKYDTIYVNGSDIDALAGFLKIKVDPSSNKEINVTLIK
jgi:glucan phosphoethanolaminetransferase (alkaline phosphatase superfamily)